MNLKKKKQFFLLSVSFLLFIAILCAAAALWSLFLHEAPQQPQGVQEEPDSRTASTQTLSAENSGDAPAEYLSLSELVPEIPSEYTGQTDVKKNSFSDLSVPTYITKVEDTYFLVDCYHDQVIYHDNLEDPLTEWNVMTDEINKGHTLASDGLVYLVDDTENHRIVIFEKKDSVFVHTQTFSDIGSRPHYIVYNKADGTFYAWSSMSGEMFLFRHDPGNSRMYLAEIRRIDILDNVYVRSFTIDGSDIYFVSGNSNIIRADLETFEILETYPVPDTMAGMIQLTRIGGYFYLTVSTDINGNQDYATIVRTKDLSSLKDGGYEDIYGNFIGGGTPYYITYFDDAYYLTEHRLPGHSVWRFEVSGDQIINPETIY